MSSAKPRRFDREVDGIVLLDKPRGMTSNAALQRTRTLFRALKAGHAGSLDPMATGMLPICFGHATKVCAFLLDERKTYRFVAKLGVRTNTGDAEGTVIDRVQVPSLDEANIQDVFGRQLGEQKQTPPMYSALKHEGERLYELARRGEEVERPPRTIVIESLRLIRWSSDEIEAEVRCSKGTYIRTLAEDIAKRLGTVAHLIELRRLQVDPFPQDSLYALDHLEALAEEGNRGLEATLLPTDRALSDLAAVSIDGGGESALLCGQNIVASAALPVGAMVRIYGPGPRFLGVGEVAADGLVRPRRLFVNTAPNSAINL